MFDSYWSVEYRPFFHRVKWYMNYHKSNFYVFFWQQSRRFTQLQDIKIYILIVRLLFQQYHLISWVNPDCEDNRVPFSLIVKSGFLSLERSLRGMQAFEKCLFSPKVSPESRASYIFTESKAAFSRKVLRLIRGCFKKKSLRVGLKVQHRERICLHPENRISFLQQYRDAMPRNPCCKKKYGE